MTDREIDRMLRKTVSDESWRLLRLISGDHEPYIANGWNGVGPLEFEIPGFKVNIGIVVKRA